MLLRKTYLLLMGCLLALNCRHPPDAAFDLANTDWSYPLVEYRRTITLDEDSPRPFRRAPRIALDRREQVILGEKSWRGPDDLSGEFRLLWGRRQLYLAALVRDDQVTYAGGPGEWGGDAVNLFLKTQSEEGVREFIFKFSCEGTRFCYYDRQSYNGEEYEWGENWAERLPGGYRVQAAIPFRNLGLLLTGENKIWFNLALEDQEDGKYMMLKGRSEGFLNAPEWLPAHFVQE